MTKVKPIIQQIAPSLAAALDTPFADFATKFITDRLIKDGKVDDTGDLETTLSKLLEKPENLQALKALDKEFAAEMKQLDIDVFTINTVSPTPREERFTVDKRPQLIITLLFLAFYFVMLFAIFYVEVSDSINMQEGSNSMMGELQILLGVLTGGIGQILSFWFGGVMKVSSKAKD